MTITKPWAFLIHLNLSLVIFGVLTATMWYLWFPGDLFFLDGGWEGLKLVAIIDLILGPALTLLLYKPGKKGLVFDMVAIAAFQIVALGYGFYATYNQQTIALVYSEGKFNTISLAAHQAANKELSELNIEAQDVRKLANHRPANIYVAAPTKDSFGTLLADALNGYPEPQERSDKYLNIADNHSELRKNRISEEDLSSIGELATVKEVLEKTDRQLDEVELYPFRARYGRGIAIFSPEKLRIVDYVEIRKKPNKAIEQANTEDP